jgi:hypothetical protein
MKLYRRNFQEDNDTSVQAQTGNVGFVEIGSDGWNDFIHIQYLRVYP